MRACSFVESYSDGARFWRYAVGLRAGNCELRTAGGGRACDGDDFQLAEAGTADSERDFESRLCAGAGVSAVDWADICAGEFFYGCGLSMGQSANEKLAAAESLRSWQGVVDTSAIFS